MNVPLNGNYTFFLFTYERACKLNILHITNYQLDKNESETIRTIPTYQTSSCASTVVRIYGT